MDSSQREQRPRATQAMAEEMLTYIDQHPEKLFMSEELWGSCGQVASQYSLHHGAIQYLIKNKLVKREKYEGRNFISSLKATAIPKTSLPGAVNTVVWPNPVKPPEPPTVVRVKPAANAAAPDHAKVVKLSDAQHMTPVTPTAPATLTSAVAALCAIVENEARAKYTADIEARAHAVAAVQVQAMCVEMQSALDKFAAQISDILSTYQKVAYQKAA